MALKREVDNDYEFKYDEFEMPYLPDDVWYEGNLYVLPNGKYLPQGVYRTDDGGALIYEPRELSPLADMMASCIGK